jgi:hypothetical protein
MPTHPRRRRYVLCLSKRRLPGLARGAKGLRRALGSSAATQGLLRVVDESGDDYLYPRSAFAPLELPANVEHALAQG